MNRTARIAALGVFVIAALATGRALTDALPTESGHNRASADPFIVEGEVGKRADLRYASVTVERVRPALAVEMSPANETTPGHLLLVDLKVVARAKPVVLGGFSLLTPDGRRYHADKRWPIGEMPTGVPWHITPIFEVPADALEGAVLEVAKGSDWWEQRRDHVLHVDLGISKADAEEFAANRDVVPRPEHGLEPILTEPVGEVPVEQE